LYDAEKSIWSERLVLIKVNLDAVAGRGAMRECFKIKIQSSPTEKDLQWYDLCSQSIWQVFEGIGRKTALRIRGALDLPPVSYQHVTILTIGEVFQYVSVHGYEAVEGILGQECHDWNGQVQFRKLVDDYKSETTRWAHGSLNCMAKRYMDSNIGHDAYREDIVMQATSKIWCTKFNALRPPKEIDMLYVGLIELVDRDERPLLGYESFITGEYIKWNTNTGWVEDKVIRHTPHAFSFASFRLSKGQLMVVDVQGVDDLYTDPQIHALSGDGFGNGNLGARGMALFLRSFRFDLNPIVKHFGLCPFITAPGEQAALDDNDPLVLKANAGSSYLDSDEWQHRRLTRSVSQEVDDEDLDPVPFILKDAAANLDVMQCPLNANDLIPLKPSAEAQVHHALAVLYDEADERVVNGLACCTAEDASKFRGWMAALAGDSSAMMECAELSNNKLAWYNIAALRGSQDGAMKAIELVSSDDHITIINYLQLALQNAMASDADQRREMKVTRFEIHEMLGQGFENISEPGNALEHYKAAAEICLEMNLFKLNTRLMEHVERLS